MPTHRLPARFTAPATLAALFVSTAAIGATTVDSAASPTASSPSTTATVGAARAQTEVFQQRGANGGIVLTDRPSPSRTTERVWQIEREDPGAAERRAEAVRREARTVSERVQRQLDSQRQRAAEIDLQRRQLDADERERQLELARIDAEHDASPYFYAPYGYAPGLRLGAPFARPPLVQGRFGQERFGEQRSGVPRIGERSNTGPRIGERSDAGPRIGERSDAGPRIGETRFDRPRADQRRFDDRLDNRPRPGLQRPDAGRNQPPRKVPHGAPRRADSMPVTEPDER